MLPRTLQTPRRRAAQSAAIARRAVREARKAAPRGSAAVATVLAVHQAFNALQAEAAVAQQLAEQSIEEAAQALLNSLMFTTDVEAFVRLLGAATTQPDVSEEFATDRLITSLVQDAGRSAEQVAVTTRENVGWTRQLTPPSCSRCVVLAGRFYRYSDGFLRHPGDDCVTIAVRQGDATYAADVDQLIRDGLVTGLSKADREAITLGADFNQVVNVRSKTAGLTQAGEVLSRGGRLTPAGIFRQTRNGSREDTLAALQEAGYIR